MAEALSEVESVKEKYKWILQVPERELSMKFQEVRMENQCLPYFLVIKGG